MSGDDRKSWWWSSSLDLIDFCVTDTADRDMDEQVMRSGDGVRNGTKFEGGWVLPQGSYPMKEHSFHLVSHCGMSGGTREGGISRFEGTRFADGKGRTRSGERVLSVEGRRLPFSLFLFALMAKVGTVGAFVGLDVDETAFAVAHRIEFRT